VLRKDKWHVKGNLVLKEEGKIYIPKDKKLKAEIIQLHHNYW